MNQSMVLSVTLLHYVVFKFGTQFLLLLCDIYVKISAWKCSLIFSRVLTNVFEGQEKADFWNILGGKEDYAAEKSLQVRTT